MKRSKRITPSFSRNFLALVVATLSIGVVHLNADPISVGASPLAKTDRFSIRVPKPVPLSEPIASLPALERSDEDGQQANPSVERASGDQMTLHGIWGLKMTTALLEKGCHAFSKVPDYTATMTRQERIGGTLSDNQTIDIKMRHEPFSVYMKWLSGDRGRQVIYVEGQNEGNMLVQPGGIRGRLTGVLSLEPNGSLALSESRHPVTKAGLLALANTILEYQRDDLARGKGFRFVLQDGQVFEGRPCWMSICEYESPEYNQDYRKSVIYVDKELSMPICVKNYTWARDANPETIDEETLIEFYAYTDLRIEQKLGSTDFDQNNRSYKLRVKK